MSLVVWLPLTKDLRNQGLDNVTVTNNGATFDSAGKLGGCYSFNGSSYLQSNEQIGNGWKEASFACWIYPGETVLTSGQWYRILGIGAHTRMHLDVASDNTLRLFVSKTGATSNGLGVYSTTTIQANKWYHMCGILGNDYMSIYINGIKEREVTIDSSSITYTNADYFRIGSINSGNPFVGKIDDVRIYDHCLSPMEVKELAKGLVLHYPLCNQYETGQVNKYSSPYSDGECSSSSFTKTKLTNERGYNYKLTRTGDGTNNWPNWNVPNYSFTAGKTYYYSVKIRCNKWTSGDLVLRASRSNNDWVTRGVTICSPSLADGKWHEYYTYQTVNANYDRSGTTVTSNPVLEFYCSNQNGNGTVYDMDFDVKDVQVIESDCYVPFIENSFVGTTIYDCSGFCNNGTRTGTFTCSSDAPKYQGSVIFNGTDNLIEREGLPIETKTIVSWIKWYSLPSGYTIPIHDKQSGLAIGITSANRLISYIGTAAGGTGSCVNVSLAVNQWYHIAVIKTGDTTRDVYINGEKITSMASNNWWGGDVNNLYIGGRHSGGSYRDYFNGQMCDVRAYATALSADDVKSLYQNSAYIDNSGNVYGAVHSEV